jgi:hypothetical protein
VKFISFILGGASSSVDAGVCSHQRLMLSLPVTSICASPVCAGNYGQTLGISLLISISGTPVRFVDRRRQRLVPMLAPALDVSLSVTSIYVSPVFAGKHTQRKRRSLLLGMSGTPVKSISRRRQTLVPTCAPSVEATAAVNRYICLSGVCRQAYTEKERNSAAQHLMHAGEVPQPTPVDACTYARTSG